MELWSELWSYVATLIVGGGAVAIYNNLWNRAEQKAARRAEYLGKQLQNLYGPIHYLCGQNAATTAYVDLLRKACKIEYEAPEKSERLSSSGRDDHLRVIDIENRYGQLMIENNQKIADVMLAHFSLVDINDIPAFHDFCLQATRHRVEWSGERWELPFELNKHVLPVRIFWPQFPEVIAKRFAEKQSELAALRGHKHRSSIMASVPSSLPVASPATPQPLTPAQS